MSKHVEEPQRIDAATAIESRMKELAEQTGFTINCGEWNLGQGMNHRGPHRLDVRVSDRTVRLYFTDDELIAYLQHRGSSVAESTLNLLVHRLLEPGASAAYISPLTKRLRH